MPFTSAAKPTAPLSVLIIAEPGIITDHISGALAGAGDLQVLGPYELGADGISKLRRQHVDCIVIDIGMRHENALISLNRILKIDEKAKVLMASTLTFTNVKKSMTGFERGAADFIQTPADFTKQKSKASFDAALLRAVRSLAQARRGDGIRQIDTTAPLPKPPGETLTLRPFQNVKPALIAIASSTGGPQALFTVLERLTADLDVPVMITQHMPKTFTRVLASNLAGRTNKTIVEATDGEAVSPGTVYIAPGDTHMLVHAVNGRMRIKLTEDPAVNFCRPSADPMLESIAQAYGAEVCAVVLTGMGSDGKAGAKHIIDAGGQVIAQDFATSVVWGMPGAVSKAGYCSKILPLDKIAPLLNSLLGHK
ncbi:MAG: chemotaxis-specific protein-glutamate methyltransferase CheB [Rhodospirillales bacterium]|nr:chemotaxis-specific protein-glutamate methyltransferase CheB [Rhodospirillales bacterium]